MLSTKSCFVSTGGHTLMGLILGRKICSITPPMGEFCTCCAVPFRIGSCKWLLKCLSLSFKSLHGRVTFLCPLHTFLKNNISALIYVGLSAKITEKEQFSLWPLAHSPSIPAIGEFKFIQSCVCSQLYICGWNATQCSQHCRGCQ